MPAPFLSTVLYQIVVSKPPAVPEASGETIVGGVLNLVFLALAAISSIVLVIQGIKYSLSSGEAEKVSSARSGIIYSLVGITVTVTSWSLVNFTLDRVIRATSHEIDESSIANLFTDIVGFIIFIGGIIAVIMIIVGAIRMTLSGGNADQAKSARNTIIYALIGAVISTLAGPLMIAILNRL